MSIFWPCSAVDTRALDDRTFRANGLGEHGHETDMALRWETQRLFNLVGDARKHLKRIDGHRQGSTRRPPINAK
eukprot:814619-Pyramimonas_sp.AAC.1